MIFASGSCLIHSLNIIPQFRAISGDSYLQKEKTNMTAFPPITVLLKLPTVPVFRTGSFRHVLTKWQRSLQGASLSVEYVLRGVSLAGTHASVAGDRFNIKKSDSLASEYVEKAHSFS